MSCGKVALVIGSERPVDSVLYREPMFPWDAGFDVLMDDAPYYADDLKENDERVQPVCLHCLINQWPELGKGLDLAREHGEAGYDAERGEWFLWPEEAR